MVSHRHGHVLGVMTGYPPTPPLGDEARANWLLKYADSQEADLKASHGYGDSHADAAWLDLVGSPHAISPDLGLRSEEHTSELQSRGHLVCRLLLEKKKKESKITQKQIHKNISNIMVNSAKTSDRV